MVAVNFPPCPPTLKPIMHFLKVALEHDERNPVVSYWCRLHALQMGIKLSAGRKNKEETLLLTSLMDWLEATKKELCNNEAVTNDACAQATLEEYCLKLFKYADEQDRAGNFNKNVVKAFYTCGIVMDVLNVFGELPEDICEKQKYAKWKAAYIHNCLKNGEVPIPGPMGGTDGTEENEENIPGNTSPTQPPPQPQVPEPYNQPASIHFDPVVPPPTPKTPPINPPSYNPPIPSTSVNPSSSYTLVTDDGIPLNPEQISKAQKYCKYASSALNYDDTKTAINNLRKALELLTTGNDPS